MVVVWIGVYFMGWMSLTCKAMYNSHPHERHCTRECLGNELPCPRHCVFPNPYLSFSLFIQPFLAFNFHLLIPLGMHSLHRTWGDRLLARGQSSCFLFFLGSLLCFYFFFALLWILSFNICSFYIFYIFCYFFIYNLSTSVLVSQK